MSDSSKSLKGITRWVAPTSSRRYLSGSDSANRWPPAPGSPISEFLGAGTGDNVVGAMPRDRNVQELRRGREYVGGSELS